MLSQHEMQEIVSDSLKKIGVGEQACALYALSLKLGPTSIALLASHLGVSRPQAYKLISELERFGLADFSARKKFMRTFVVQSPSRLQEALRRHEKETEQADQRLTLLMPDLLATYQQGSELASVRTLQGKEQYLKVFFQCVEEAANKEIMVMGSAKDFIAFITWAEERRWINERIRLNVRLRALLFPSEDTQTLASADQKELRETRLLRDMDPFSPLVMIYANKLILWQPSAPMAIHIEDNYLVAMMRSLYEVMWKRAGRISTEAGL